MHTNGWDQIELVHILCHYNLQLPCILRGFYAVDQHKVVHTVERKENDSRKNLKTVAFACILPQSKHCRFTFPSSNSRESFGEIKCSSLVSPKQSTFLHVCCVSKCKIKMWLLLALNKKCKICEGCGVFSFAYFPTWVMDPCSSPRVVIGPWAAINALLPL